MQTGRGCCVEVEGQCGRREDFQDKKVKVSPSRLSALSPRPGVFLRAECLPTSRGSGRGLGQLWSQRLKGGGGQALLEASGSGGGATPGGKVPEGARPSLRKVPQHTDRQATSWKVPREPMATPAGKFHKVGSRNSSRTVPQGGGRRSHGKVPEVALVLRP